MGGRIDTILMSVKFGADPISSLDFSFTGGGVPLITVGPYIGHIALTYLIEAKDYYF